MTWVKRKLVLVHLEIVLISKQDRCTVCTKHTSLRNHFGHILWYSSVTWVKWKLISVYLEIVLIWAQGRCWFCTECATGMKIILGATS